MSQVKLTLQEFLEFKKYFKFKYQSSSVIKGAVYVTARKDDLALFGF